MHNFKVKVVILEIYIGQSWGHGRDVNDSFSQHAKFHYPDSKTQNNEQCSSLCSTPIIEHCFHANGIGHTFWLLKTIDKVLGLNVLPNLKRWGYQQKFKSVFLLSMLSFQLGLLQCILSNLKFL